MKSIHKFFAAIFPLDKTLHFSVSYIIASVAFIISIPFGIATSLTAGVIKEISDMLYFNGWSWGDIAADILGIALAVLIYLLY